MLSFSSQRLKSLLVLGAHSDDIEIGCGGLVAKLMENYDDLEINWVVFSGDAIRRQEASDSAAHLLRPHRGNVEIGNFQDSYFPAQYAEIKSFLHRLAERVAPDLVLTHRLDDAHQDHRVVGELTHCVFRSALVLEYEIPKLESDTGHCNFFITLSAAECQRKIDHLLDCFPSQQSKSWFTESTFRATLRLRGIQHGADYGEGFLVRRIVADLGP